MAIRNILTYGESVLRAKCRPIDFDLDTDLVAEVALDLLDTVRASDCDTLAAPQIGYPVRMIGINPRRFSTVQVCDYVLVNPVIVSFWDGMFSTPETFPSLPGFVASIGRFRSCKTAYQTVDGNARFLSVFTSSGRSLACGIQKGTDHLDGKLPIDHLPLEQKTAVIRGFRRAATA
jgi:peptide deformylase